MPPHLTFDKEMNAKLLVVLPLLLACVIASASAAGNEARVAALGLMSARQLSTLEQSYRELTALKSKGPLGDKDRTKFETCLKAISEEDRKRKAFFELLKEGDNIADYPGILAKVRIGYETSPVNNESKAYEMFVFPSVATDDSQVFMWIRVDLRGNILKKVHRFTGAD